MEYQLDPSHQVLFHRQSIGLRRVPGPWDSGKNQLLPTDTKQTSVLVCSHMYQLKCARICLCTSLQG